MSIHRRRRRLAAQWPAAIALAIVWVLLWGDLSWANVLGGLALGLLVTLVLPLPAIGYHGTARPLGLLHLAARFGYDLVVASFQVSMQAFRFGHQPRGAVVGVRLRSSSDLYLTLVAELSSLVPGSLVIEAHRLTGMLYLHVLDIDSYGGVERVRTDVLALERRVLRALASDEELARAGVSRSARPPRGTASTAPAAAAPTSSGATPTTTPEVGP